MKRTGTSFCNRVLSFSIGAGRLPVFILYLLCKTGLSGVISNEDKEPELTQKIAEE
jgi:hypothetical protein